MGDYLFWIYEEIYRHRGITKDTCVHISPGSYPGDLRRGMKNGMGNLTCDHVYFITVGHRDDHVSILCPSLS